MSDDSSKHIVRCAWSVREWAQAVNLSLPSVYGLMKSGSVESRKFGVRRLITTAPKDWLETLPKAS